ncbi:MAG: MarC family protein [Rhodobacteraceae bacterium]|nr:MarC family protein [Paracoccaceae bacterium]
MTDVFFTSFVTLFVIIDPIGLTPMFIALTRGTSAAERRAIALRATGVAFVILALFAVLGESLLSGIGIGMPAFRISGGVLLFLTAVDMLFERRSARRDKQSESSERADPSVFPMATPLIAGPGSMAAMILLVGNGDVRIDALVTTVSAMFCVIIVALALFLLSGGLERLLGRTGINVITRLLGMLLAALAVQFIVDGVRDLGVLA